MRERNKNRNIERQKGEEEEGSLPRIISQPPSQCHLYSSFAITSVTVRGRRSASSSSSSSYLSSPGRSTVLRKQWRVSPLFVLVFWAGQRWPRPKSLGWAQSNIFKKSKKSFQNFFSCLFFYQFCTILVCIFIP